MTPRWSMTTGARQSRGGRLALAVTSVAFLVHCASDRAVGAAAAPAKPQAAQVGPPRECKALESHARSLFGEFYGEQTFRARDLALPLIVPSVDRSRVQRIEKAIGEPAPPVVLKLTWLTKLSSPKTSSSKARTR